MKFKSMKKLLAVLGMTTALMLSAAISASACTTIYVGANLTEENTPFVARTEDYGADMNKLWYINEAGAFKAGETYRGCPAYGAFEWTFTHDSYAMTYFTNDIYYDCCPECGEGEPGNPPTHYSYTEFGTNEHGVSVSATETISGNKQVTTVDPMHQTLGSAGIEETDIPFVLLAEAASAREAVELLLDIYDERGAYFASGIFVCDRNETWYIENCSGTQYVAIKLNDDLIFLEPNTAVIGEIDLDDENVLYSDRLIAVAKEAGTFVGDEAENIIDFRASYANVASVGAPRMVDGLNFLNEDYGYTADDLFADNTKFTISNLKDGGIVPFYTNIKADRILDKDDVFNYYKLSSIGKPSNQEIEIFQLFNEEDYPELEDEYATVGWVGVGNMSNNVFVPYFPMLIDDVYEGYQVSTAVTSFTTEKPDGFATWGTSYVQNENGGWDRVSGYKVYPENWRDSYYFTFEGLGGYILYAEQIDGAPVSDSAKAYILNKLADLQQKIYDDFVTVEELTAAEDPRALATANGMAMAEEAHMLGLELVDYVTADIASIGEGEECLYYDSLADAIEAVQNGETVKLLHNSDETVTVSSKLTFTLDTNGYEFTGEIKAGSGYRCRVNDNVYTITRKSSGSSSSSTPAPKGWDNPYEDIGSNSEYYKAVEYVSDNGLMVGVDEDTFAPYMTLNRAQMVQILWAKEDKPAAAAAAFSDVAADAWYVDSVNWAAANGIVAGVGEGKFAPDVDLTVEQVAVILYSYVGKPAAEDMAIEGVSDWAQTAMAWATGAGVIAKDLAPQTVVTRGVMAQILLNLSKI